MIVNYGEIFHRDSPAHIKRMHDKALTEAAPSVYRNPFIDDGDIIIDTPQKRRGMWSRILDRIFGEPVPPDRAFPEP